MTKSVNKLELPEFRDLFREHDVVLFTETWTNEKSDIEVDEFKHIALHRTVKHKRAKRDSGGVILYYRTTISHAIEVVFTDSDDIVCVKLNAGFFQTDFDIYLYLCYVVPEQSSRQAVIEKDAIERLYEHIVRTETVTGGECGFLLCGDFNARTQTAPDYVADDTNCTFIQLPDDYVSDSVMPRASRDRGQLNEHGHALLDLCRRTGIRIVNGRLGDDSGIGDFTFINSRGRSVVDYVLCSEKLFTLFRAFSVGPASACSDHCPVQFAMSLYSVAQCDLSDGKSASTKTCTPSYKWKGELTQVFADRMSDPDVKSKFDDIQCSGKHGMAASEVTLLFRERWNGG